MKLPAHIKGLVFDCDGTLADTMPMHWRAWQMLAKEQGVTLDHIQAAHEKENAYLPLMAEVEPIHAVVEIARENFGKIPMAVASGGTLPIIEQVLTHLKIRHLFGAVVTSEMVKNQKPAPDIFVEAARRIGVDPKFCRAYEDTDLGRSE